MTEKDFLTIVADELMIAPEAIGLDSEFRTIPTWTSLNSLLVVSRLHEETGYMISANDLANLITLGELFDLIQS